MTSRLLCSFLFGLLAALWTHNLGADHDLLVEFYEKHLRGSLFSGLLTVGGFLLSLKTFILIKLKDNVYDHHEYKKRFDEQKELDPDLKRYKPLQNLSDFLYYSVISTIAAAIFQLTLGIFGNYYLVLFIIGFSISALMVLIFSLDLIRNSLNDWFDFINDDNTNKADKQDHGK